MLCWQHMCTDFQGFSDKLLTVHVLSNTMPAPEILLPAHHAYMIFYHLQRFIRGCLSTTDHIIPFPIKPSCLEEKATAPVTTKRLLSSVDSLLQDFHPT